MKIPRHIKEEITSLYALIAKYQKEYYETGRSTVSDREYDRLFERLVHLEQEFPELMDPASVTLRVGSDLNQDFPEVAHTIPVLSLDKCHSAAELLAWMEKTTRLSVCPLNFILEEKIDGASLVLYYEQGNLVRAVTRGNGFVGNDITGNVKTIDTVPHRLPEPINLAVRGEVFLRRKYFDSLNKQMEVPYANPRNLAAGVLRRIKSSQVAQVPLELFIYEGYFDKGMERLASHAQILLKLSKLGFNVNHSLGFFGAGTKGTVHPNWYYGETAEVSAFIEQKRAARSALEYDIDGLVMKVNEIEARKRLGFTGHHPRWALAFKFDSPAGRTVLKGIDIQIGRTGRVTPVARCEPVVIAGTTVSNATLHNYEYIKSLELALEDKIEVTKRGDIIPAVERVLEKNEVGNKTYVMSEFCPDCSARLKLRGAHHFCPNEACPGQVKGRLIFFADRKQMDIENLGPETMEYLYNTGYVKNIEDIYSFNPESLVNATGFGRKKVELIKQGILKSKSKPFATVLTALGIPELGPNSASQIIAAGYDSMDNLLALAEHEDYAALEAIGGIGNKTAHRLVEAFRKPALLKTINALKKAGLKLEAEEKTAQDFSLLGQTWCVTGSLQRFKPRELAMDEVKKRGGQVSSGITAKTTHLLAGESAGSKLDKARRQGINVVTEQEFIKMLGL